MKKIILSVLAIAMALSITACGAGNIGADGKPIESSQASSEESKAPAPEKTKDLTGMQEYMKWAEYLSGDPKEMQGGFIGAKDGGVKYQFKYENSDVTVELYEFDKNALNDTAKEVIESVKSTGKFTMLGQDVEAVLSDNEKYLMIYRDGSTDEKNVARKDEVLKFFKSYE